MPCKRKRSRVLCCVQKIRRRIWCCARESEEGFLCIARENVEGYCVVQNHEKGLVLCVEQEETKQDVYDV